MKRANLSIIEKITIMFIYFACTLVVVIVFAMSLLFNGLKFSRLLAVFSILPFFSTCIYEMVKKCKMTKVQHKLDVIEFIPTFTIFGITLIALVYEPIVNFIVLPESCKKIVDLFPNIITAFSILVYFVTITKDRIKKLFLTEFISFKKMFRKRK